MKTTEKSTAHNDRETLTTIGWREWIALPELGIDTIKTKVDTGARTSALHAFSIEPYTENNIEKVRFKIHPKQKSKEIEITCEANVFDKRIVTDSGGHKETRYVILTPIVMNNQSWEIEITLTERDTMLFRMLLGRTAIKKRFIVNPARSFLTTKAEPK